MRRKFNLRTLLMGTLFAGALLGISGRSYFREDESERVLFQGTISGERLELISYKGKKWLHVETRKPTHGLYVSYYDYNNDKNLDAYSCLESHISINCYGFKGKKDITPQDQQAYNDYLNKIKQVQAGN